MSDFNLSFKNFCIDCGFCLDTTEDIKNHLIEYPSHKIAELQVRDDYKPSDSINRNTLMAEIFQNVSSQEQLNRMLNVIDKYTSFIVALDNLNYDLAKSRLSLMLSRGDLLQEDYDLALSKFP